jgi:hypothetical protein
MIYLVLFVAIVAKIIYMHSLIFGGFRGSFLMDEIFIDVRDSDLTLSEIFRKIEEIQSEHPDLDIFLDGDMHAIRGLPRSDLDSDL